jgi:hypothetical protein
MLSETNISLCVQAEDVLSRALNMPGIKTVDAKNSFALGERVSIFLGLARILQQLGKIPEATKVDFEQHIFFIYIGDLIR